MNNNTPQLPQIVPITNKRTKDLTGQSFGRLTVLGFAGRNKWQKAMWLCRCECGNYSVVLGGSLLAGRTISCRCLFKEQLGANRRTHGKSNTAEYGIWQAMITRCENSNQAHYERYGGRGITVCEEWRDHFEQFLSDMGPRPGPRYSIDRIDNALGYSPENCRWATDIEQANNTTHCHYLEFQGEQLSIAQWAKRIGISRTTLSSRLRKGWSIEKTLTEPVGWHWSHHIGPPAIPIHAPGLKDDRLPALSSSVAPESTE